MGSIIVAGLLLALVGMTLAHRRREQVEWGRLAETQRVALGQVLEELSSLRAALVAAGAVERLPRLPPPPPVAEPSLPLEEPPSTRPSQSRRVPTLPRSAPRAVPIEDEIQRAMRRIERQARVPPAVQARWEQRLRALGAELGLPPEGELTDGHLATLIRELYEAEADLKDARTTATDPGPPDAVTMETSPPNLAAPPPLEATLASATAPVDDGGLPRPSGALQSPRAPVEVRIAQAALKTDDAEGETTLRREGDRPAALPRAPEDDDWEEGRETGEDMTKVWSHRPGVEAKPRALRPPHRPPRPIADPLAGVTPERPKPSATRAAQWFRNRPDGGGKR